jgi:hypothetical protein
MMAAEGKMVKQKKLKDKEQNHKYNSATQQ